MDARLHVVVRSGALFIIVLRTASGHNPTPRLKKVAERTSSPVSYQNSISGQPDDLRVFVNAIGFIARQGGKLTVPDRDGGFRRGWTQCFDLDMLITST